MKERNWKYRCRFLNEVEWSNSTRSCIHVF